MLPGCPDTQAQWNAFLEDTKDARVLSQEGEPCVIEGSTLNDLEGTFLLALLARFETRYPLQFLATVHMRTKDGAPQADFSFQPLSLKVHETLRPRQPVGTAIKLVGVPLGADGRFLLDLGEMDVAGAANPITGSDIRANVQLCGVSLGDDFFCGEVIAGEVVLPTPNNLVGSTFAASRVATTRTNFDAMALPTSFERACKGYAPGQSEDTNGTHATTGDTDG